MTTFPYTQPEFDAFGWSTLSKSELPPAETHGLDYETARDATPRWFGVSFGNGNDGVSQTFPDYYCRTAAPFDLAAAAMVASFKPDGKQWAIENTEIDGEADYGISAVISDPPDDETESDIDYQDIAKSNGFCVSTMFDDGRMVYSWHAIDSEPGLPTCYDTESEAWKACCDDSELTPDDDESVSWSEVNGAWLICEVFPVDDMESVETALLGTDSDWPFGTPAGIGGAPYGKPAYLSLADCFDETDLALAAKI